MSGKFFCFLFLYFLAKPVSGQEFVKILESMQVQLTVNSNTWPVELNKGEIYPLSQPGYLVFGQLGYLEVAPEKYKSVEVSQEYVSLTENSKDYVSIFNTVQYAINVEKFKGNIQVYNQDNQLEVEFKKKREVKIEKEKLGKFFRIVAPDHPVMVYSTDEFAQGSADLTPEDQGPDLELLKKELAEKSDSIKMLKARSDAKAINQPVFVQNLILMACILAAAAFIVVIFFGLLLIRSRKGTKKFLPLQERDALIQAIKDAFREQFKSSAPDEKAEAIARKSGKDKTAGKLHELTDSRELELKKSLAEYHKKLDEFEKEGIRFRHIYPFIQKAASYLSILEKAEKNAREFALKAAESTSSTVEAGILARMILKYQSAIFELGAIRWQTIIHNLHKKQILIDDGLESSIRNYGKEEDQMKWIEKKILQEYLKKAASCLYILLEEIRNIEYFIPEDQPYNKELVQNAQREFTQYIDNLQQKTEELMGYKLKYVPMFEPKDHYARQIESKDVSTVNPLYKEIIQKLKQYPNQAYIVEIEEYSTTDNDQKTLVKVI